MIVNCYKVYFLTVASLQDCKALFEVFGSWSPKEQDIVEFPTKVWSIYIILTYRLWTCTVTMENKLQYEMIYLKSAEPIITKNGIQLYLMQTTNFLFTFTTSVSVIRVDPIAGFYAWTWVCQKKPCDTIHSYNALPAAWTVTGFRIC